MVCFLVSQEMSDFPRKTQHPIVDFFIRKTQHSIVDFLIVGQLTEFTSQNPINFKSFWVRNNKPYLGLEKREDNVILKNTQTLSSYILNKNLQF